MQGPSQLHPLPLLLPSPLLLINIPIMLKGWLLLYFMNKTDEPMPNTQDARKALQVPSEQSHIQKLQLRIKIAQQRCRRYEERQKQNDNYLEGLLQKKKGEERRLLEQMLELRKSKQRIEESYQQTKKELQLVRIIQKEKNRIIVSAAIHNTQQEIQKQKLTIEQEFLSQSQTLRTEMKEREDKMIQTLKKMHNANFNHPQQYAQIIQFIREIGSIEDLNAEIHKLKAEILTQTKEIRLLNQQVCQLEANKNTLNNQANNLKYSLQVLQREKESTNQELFYFKEQLEKQKAQNKQLQAYYSQKWVKQFEIFKLVIQRVYESKLLQLKERFQQKLAAVKTSEESHQHIHKQDQKIICTLEQEIVVLTTEIKESREIIVKLEAENTQIKQELKETQKIVETQAIQKYNQIITQKQEQISELRKQVTTAIKSKEACENKLNRLSKTMKEKFDIEKKNLQVRLGKQKEEVIKAKQEQIQIIVAKHESEEVKHKAKEQSLRHQFDYQVSQLQTKLKKESVQLSKLLQQSKTQCKEIYKESLRKQKTVLYEMQQLRKAHVKQQQKVKKQSEEKSMTIKHLHQRSKHDENAKRQLRYLYDIKSKECNQLLKENQSLATSLAQKEEEIKKLNQSIIKNDWQHLLKQLKSKFTMDLLDLTEIHWKQLQHFKKKVNELQSIICKTYLQGQEKIDNLEGHNSMLQTKLQLMRKRYTQQPRSTFLPVTPINFVQPRRNMFMSKRKRRSNFAFSQTLLKKTKQSSTAAAIVRMKRFLSRGKSTDIYDKSANTEKCATSTSPIRRHIYISTER